MPGILMASDLSERSGHALARALQLATALGAELEILHVVDDSLPSRIAEETAQTAHEILTRGAAGAGRVEVVFGHPWRRVVDRISRGRFDLAVTGAHRDRGLVDLFRGSVLHRCVQMSDAPVLVVSDRPTAPYGKVLIATSFAARDADAARLAAKLAEGASMRLVHAYRVPFGGLGYRMDETGDITKRDRDEIEEPMLFQLQQMQRRLSQDGIEAEIGLLEGRPTPALLDAVAQEGIDLLAIGRHGAEGHVPMTMGRVASELLAHLPCDLLVHPGRFPRED
ncbi:nucleotide-binding universal stress UspA family protein [Limimaricola variabilis]|uniref:Nucleotide-binding universal stress UspA family protein n=1 Tax=Limimaricola variabilis TaxID=1492771 RepID=A0ABR6HMX0_9RHOB|nr:universal stress protein [Limimaricola variabilis]MBB3711800.1 nucleotide-binding universal stress UspA family protein [Limimaricola variabilis]